MKCDKCGSTDIKVTRDRRGVPSAYCSECGAFIKKMSTGDVIDYYENKLAERGDLAPSQPIEKPKCPYCTENYYMRYGRLGSVYKPIEPKYCPMCGRELKDTDKAY